MKNNKILLMSVVMAIFSISFIACSEDDKNEIETVLTPNLESFKQNFPEKYTQLDWSTKKKIKGAEISNEFTGNNFTMIKSKSCDSYYVEIEDRGYFVEKSNNNQDFIVYSIDNNKTNINIPINRQTLVPDFTSIQPNTKRTKKSSFRYSLCVSGCGAAAAAIAMTDGPEPGPMDVLAVVYFTDCSAGCKDKWLN